MRLAAIAILLSLFARDLTGQSRLDGAWQGNWARAGDTMAVTLNVRRDSAGRAVATFDADRLRVSGIPCARLDSLVTVLRDRPWFFAPPAPDNSYWTFSRQYGQYRPLDWWARLRVPGLLIYGAEDQRVPVRASAERIAATLQRNAPDVDLTIRIVPGADHTFRLAPGPGGWPRTAPDYLPTLLRWLGGR